MNAFQGGNQCIGFPAGSQSAFKGKRIAKNIMDPVVFLLPEKEFKVIEVRTVSFIHPGPPGLRRRKAWLE